MTKRFESRPTKTSRGFTLIEVLVVVAIIALLISIMLPSLRRARIQAQNVACSANIRQIGTNAALYQTEFNDFLPNVTNWYMGTRTQGDGNMPAGLSYISLALRRYEPGLRNLANIVYEGNRTFDPTALWDRGMRMAYEQRLLPEHYFCPLSRGHDVGWRDADGPRVYGIPVVNWEGRIEAYHSWLHHGHVRRGVRVRPTVPVGFGGHPDNGIPQYSALPWNGGFDAREKTAEHGRWDDAAVRGAQGGTLGDITVAFCAMGENMEQNPAIYNYGRHPASRGGGTQVLFADSSVRWVQGTRVGFISGGRRVEH